MKWHFPCFRRKAIFLIELHWCSTLTWLFCDKSFESLLLFSDKLTVVLCQLWRNHSVPTQWQLHSLNVLTQILLISILCCISRIALSVITTKRHFVASCKFGTACHLSPFGSTYTMSNLLHHVFNVTFLFEH